MRTGCGASLSRSLAGTLLACGLALLPVGLAAQPPDRNPPAAQSARRYPLPDAAALEEAEKTVRQTYKDDFAKARRGAQRLALGRKLLEDAGAGHDPAVCFVLLTEARDLGVELGRADLIVSAIDEMARRYQIDGLEMKAEQLKKAARTITTRRAVARLCLDLIHEAVLADRFDLAMDFARTGYAAAEKANEDTLREQILTRGRQTLSLEKEFQRAQQAEKTLAENPNDPDANLIRGRYLCLVKEDWERGLPMLAKGADPQWQALAHQDLAGPNDAEAQLELGDAWWDMAQNMKEPARSSLLNRARRWYLEAMPSLTDPRKSKVVARLAEIKGYGGGTSTVEIEPPGESTASQSPAAPLASSGERVDVLRLVDPQKHTLAREWRLQGGELAVSPAGAPARLTIPVQPRGDYDLKLEFTRKDGFSTVGVVLPVGSRQCLLAINYRGGPSGVETIAGRRADDNPSTFVGALANDRRYTLQVAVRLDDDQAAVTAELDGRPFLFYRGPVRSLDLEREWRLPCRQCLGVIAESGAVFHTVELKMVSGEAKLLE